MKQFGFLRVGFLRVGVAAFLAAAAVGCGGGATLPLPTLSEYDRIVIVPFVSPDSELDGFLMARDLGNQLEIALKREREGIDVIFDESDELAPVKTAMAKLQVSRDDLFADPKLAGKVAADLNAGILVVAKTSKMNLDTREDDRPVFDMSEYGGLSKSDTRYTITYQNATGKIWVRAVDPHGNIAWQTGSAPPKEPGNLTAYLKYARAFKSTGVTRTPVPEDQMRAHMRDHMWRLVANAIYPSYFPAIKVPLWKEKPTQRFTTSGGEVRFE